MCEPASITAGVAVLGAGLSIADKVSQNSAKQGAVNTFQDSVIPQAITSTNEQLAQVFNSNSARTVQTNDQIATQNFDIVRSMAEAKGTATAAAGDAGVGGNSFANILSDFEMREGLARGNNDYNYKAKTQQIADENEQARTKAKAQVQSVMNQTPVAPSDAALWGGIGATAAGAGLKIADAYGVFDKNASAPDLKIDPNTGRSYGTDAATWS